MEDDLNFFNKMEDDLKCLATWKTTSILRYMEHDLHFKVNGIRPQFEGYWRTTSIVPNRRRHQFVGKCRTNGKCKCMSFMLKRKNVKCMAFSSELTAHTFIHLMQRISNLPPPKLPLFYVLYVKEDK